MKRIVILAGFSFILLVTFILHGYCWGAENPSEYPSKAITHIVPTGAGGGADLTSRQLAKVAGTILNTPIIVENKPGGGGVIGISALAKSTPDGYTISTIFYSPTVIKPHLQEVPYKTKEDFTFIVQAAEYAHAFVVLRDAPWKTFRDFVEDARKRPGKITYNSWGPKTGEHIFMERVAHQEKIKIIHVPYRSNAEQITAVLGGHVNGGLIAAIAPHILNGSVRALAVESDKRWEIIPDVPTFKELGYNFVKPRWLGIAAPKGVHKSILKKLENAFTQAFNDPAYQELVKRIHMMPVYRSGKDFRKKVFEDFDTQGRLLKTLDLGK